MQEQRKDVGPVIKDSHSNLTLQDQQYEENSSAGTPACSSNYEQIDLFGSSIYGILAIPLSLDSTR
jgi:hypothetical protein